MTMMTLWSWLEIVFKFESSHVSYYPSISIFLYNFYFSSIFLFASLWMMNLFSAIYFFWVLCVGKSCFKTEIIISACNSSSSHSFAFTLEIRSLVGSARNNHSHLIHSSVIDWQSVRRPKIMKDGNTMKKEI